MWNSQDLYLILRPLKKIRKFVQKLFLNDMTANKGKQKSEDR